MGAGRCAALLLGGLAIAPVLPAPALPDSAELEPGLGAESNDSKLAVALTAVALVEMMLTEQIKIHR